MTDQSSEGFNSELSTFRVGKWRLFGLVRGEPAKDNYGWGSGERVPGFVPREAKAQSTGNRKGYRETYVVRSNGSLLLESIRYDDDGSTERIDETVQGDFYLVLKSEFKGPRLYVPFREGTIVLSREAWKHERFTGPSPISVEIEPGCHPDFPRRAKLWYELFPEE